MLPGSAACNVTTPPHISFLKCDVSPFSLKSGLTFLFANKLGFVARGSMRNKTGTSKVGAISKAQKAQKTFKKILEIFEIFFFRKCRIVPKNVKEGTLWALLTYILLQNIKILERGTLLRH